MLDLSRIAIPKRGCGYCTRPDCEEYGKAIFSLGGSQKPWPCRACHSLVHFVPEDGSARGTSKIFREVRIEYQWDVRRMDFRCTAVVRAEHPDFWTGSVYTQRTPLINTERRALQMAERLLANLNQYGRTSAAETVLDFDSPVYAEQLRGLERLLQGKGGDPG